MKRSIMFLLAIFMISCAEEKKEDPIRLVDYNQRYKKETTSTTAETTETSDETTETWDADAKVLEISIEGNDQMKFNKKKLRVPAGSTVKLTLIHSGTLPAGTMGHNFVLLKMGTDVSDFGIKAVDFPDNSYIPTGTNKVIANTKIIGGGESVTIEFEVPAPGTYDFICSFPGHFSMMRGKFIVE